MQANPADIDAAQSDARLLAEYSATGSHDALTAIIQRHAGHVYSSCLRILGDTSSAEDASQATFLVLMRRGRSLPSDTVLVSWLYFTAQNAAREIRRGDARRAKREIRVAETSTQTTSDVSAVDDVRPEIDLALGELPTAQRDAVVLRYFEGLSLREAAQTVGCPEKTLEKRVHLALQKLRLALTRRGVAVSAVALAALLSQRTAEAAPAHLAASITSACVGKSAASAAATATAHGVIKTMALAKAKSAVLAAVVALAVCVPAGYVAAATVFAAPQAPKTSATAASVVPAAKAPQAVAQARVAGIPPIRFDFEDGRPVPGTTGKVVAGPARAGNRFAIAGEIMADEGGICRVRFSDEESFVTVGREALTLSFDYWADENTASLDVFSWNTTRQKVFITVLMDVKQGQWTRVTIPLADFKCENETVKADDVLQTLTIQTGQKGSQHYIDNVEIKPAASTSRDF